MKKAYCSDSGDHIIVGGKSKDMIIAQLIQVDPGIVEILFAAGMHCIGCPSAQGESLEEACMVHGIEVDVLVDAINEHLSANA